MALQERLNHWRSERARLLQEIATVRQAVLLSVLQDELGQAERFIRHYEGEIAKGR